MSLLKERRNKDERCWFIKTNHDHDLYRDDLCPCSKCTKYSRCGSNELDDDFYMLVAVLLYAFPISLISGEFAGMFPQKGGPELWVSNALGKK